MKPDSYNCPSCPIKTELIVERSRFIGLAYPLKDEDEAVQILNSLKKEYYDASHICYAFIADEAANRTRFSDNGEPQGTAGQPILNALKNDSFRRTLLAVVRYFGGIKLGTGGLNRAYSESARLTLQSGNIDSFINLDSYNIEVTYSDFNILESKLKAAGFAILNLTYGQNVNFTAVHPSKNLDPTQITNDVTSGDGKIEYMGEGFIKRG